MQKIRFKYENLIKNNNYQSVGRQRDIRRNYGGTERAQIIQVEFLESFERNKRLWYIYQTLDLANRNRRSQLRRMRQKLASKVKKI